MEWNRSLPSKLPCRVHHDSGYPHTSWSGELRAVVDGDQLVVRVWSPRKGWRYRVEGRWWWEEGHIQPGPLPRRKPRGEPTPVG